MCSLPIITVGSDKVDVYVKHASGQTTTFYLIPSDPVRKIYDRVAEVEKVSPSAIRIKYTGKVLNPELTVGYMGICAETILKAEVIEVRPMTVCVKFENETVKSYNVNNTSLVSDVIDQIVNEEKGLQEPRLMIMLAGRDIAKLKTSTLMDAGITDNTILQLQIKPDSAVVAGTPPPAEGSQGLSSGDKEQVIDSFNAAGRPVDVVFSFDTTGSMFSCLEKVREKLGETVRTLIQRVPGIRIGLIAHGDYCDYDNYVLRSCDLTSDVTSLVRFAKDVPVTGGGDCPECYEWVLRKAQQMDWAENSAKALVVIGDADPHPPSYTDQRINWHSELDVLIGMDVKVYGVRAQSIVISDPFYRELAERSGGAYIMFNNFDIITEMFLAVCYREASDGQYQQYCDEIMLAQDNTTSASASASVNDGVKQLIQQLDEQSSSAGKRNTTRYVALPWWDPTLDKATPPQYQYDSRLDQWKPICHPIFIVDEEEKRKDKGCRKKFGFNCAGRSRTSRNGQASCSVM